MKKEKESAASPAGKGLSSDLVELCILPRLSAKALMKFKCVSKAWHRIISVPHPGFIHMQLQHASSGLLLKYESSEMRKCLSKVPGNIGTLCFTHPLSKEWSRIVASCNGLVCIYGRNPNRGWSPTVYIGNPFLKDWKQLPPPCPSGEYLFLWGLAVGVGETSFEYKLVVWTESHINGHLEYEFRVLSSTIGQWKVVKERLCLELMHPDGVGVYVMGSLYWKITTSGGPTVLRFSLVEELCSLQPLPEGSEDGRIGECRGKLCCTMFKEGEIEMWFLDRSHWTKRFSINLQTCIGREPWYKMQLRPIMMPFEGGDHFSFSVQGTIYLYDLLTGEIYKQLNDWNRFSVIPYKNTLVPVPQSEMD